MYFFAYILAIAFDLRRGKLILFQNWGVQKFLQYHPIVQTTGSAINACEPLMDFAISWAMSPPKLLACSPFIPAKVAIIASLTS